jgi:hypothetical protein
MKKIAINDQHGGFGLSPAGLKRWCDLQNKECYFFKRGDFGLEGSFEPITAEEAKNQRMFWSAFNVPNPNDVLPDQSKFYEMTLEERSESNKKYSSYQVSDRSIPRDDTYLIQVIKELKEEANGFASNLKIVEIPDDVNWIIEDYDGAEHVAEVHRTWY